MTEEKQPAKPGLKSTEAWFGLTCLAAVTKIAAEMPTWVGVGFAACAAMLGVTYMVMRTNAKKVKP